MTPLVIPDLDDAILTQLRERAATHGRTPESEAKAILTAVLRASSSDPWARVQAIHDHLASSGRVFSDSADLLREDRER